MEENRKQELAKAVLGGRGLAGGVHECRSCHRLFGKDDLKPVEETLVTDGIAPSGKCPVCAGWTYQATVQGVLALEEEDIRRVLHFIRIAGEQGHNPGILAEMPALDQQGWERTLDRFRKILG